MNNRDIEHNTSSCGRLAMLRFRVLPSDPSDETRLWDRAQSDRSMIEDGIRSEVRKILGSQYHVDVVFLHGSVEIIATLVGAYVFISRWDNFCRSLERLGNQIRALLQRLLDPGVPGGVEVEGYQWINPDLVAQDQLPLQVRHEWIWLLWYVCLTNVIMLLSIVALLWIAFFRLSP